VPAGVLGSDEVGTDQDPRLAEERRLFYVACTRAERRLVLLAKKNKARSSATHFLEEILDDDLSNSAGARLVEEIAVSDVLEQAAAVAGRAPSGAGPDALRGMRAPDGGGTLSVRDRRRELLEQARREARLSAAGALGLADAADASPERIAEVSAILTRAARRMAAIAAVESRGRAPEWVEELDEPTRRAIEQLAAAVGEPEAVRESSGSWITRVPRPPLDLSYTSINDYLTCPRCYYVKHVLRLTGEEGRPMVLGGAMHIALERFYEAFKEQDAAGRPVPGLDDLLQIARDEYLGLLRADEPLDRAELDQLLAQARLGFERLHDPGIHVIETERRIAFDYISVPVLAEAGGRRRKKPEEDAPIADRASMPGATTHRMIAKIDRIDQVTMPDGRLGFRIVDYKTGHATEKFTEPKADDLQMGIYALALRHEYGDEAGAIGQAEYWLFSTGQRGRISLADINHAAVRRQIDLAVTGILAGRFEQAKACRGDCELLGLSA
jgi:RecB family exonuclease